MAQLNCNDRRGPVRVSFPKLLDVKIYISEKFQEPNVENASWVFTDPIKCFVLKPKD